MIRNIINGYRMRLDSIFGMLDKIEGSTELKNVEREKIYEGLFLDAYKNYELTIEKIFLEGMISRESIRRMRFKSYIKPRNIRHAKEMMLLEKEYLKWNDPGVIIKRAETIFESHQIISAYIKQNYKFLNDARSIRNAIAHSSTEALKKCIQITVGYLGTQPLVRRTPGWFLCQNIRTAEGGYIKVIRQFLNNYYNMSHYYL